MDKPENGRHNLFVVIPSYIWERILKETMHRHETVKELVLRALQRELKIPDSEMPPRRLPGRPPKPRP